MSKLDTIEKLVRGVDDYLNSNQLNQICSSSIGHNELKQALTALTELRKEMEWQPTGNPSPNPQRQENRL